MGDSGKNADRNNAAYDSGPTFRRASFTALGQAEPAARAGVPPRFPTPAEICMPSASGDARADALERAVVERLGHVTDPELGRSVVDLHMITRVEAVRRSAGSGMERPVQAGPDDAVYDVRVDLELTVSGCPLTRRLLDAVTAAAQSCSRPGILVVPQITVSAMSEAKLSGLVAELRASRRRNPFADPSRRTKIFAIASGKGG
ncbi:MAG: DUF59 domain-containing protein, partial [Aeriscardovia sp.]|nr:DUF59 domain-containing protein [Aeriscardovia sp.]